MSKYRLSVFLFVAVIGSIPELRAQDLWLMKGHDNRRTGQSESYGPITITESENWTAEEPGAFVLNIGASVDNNGVYYGSWGLLRKDTTQSPLFWDKSDGQVFGRDLMFGNPLWGGPVDLDLNPRCYDYPGRTRTGDDVFWCGLFNTFNVSFYNGTVEGQAAIDTSRQTMYFGRGDGRLFAINSWTGEIIWRYQTYNPLVPDDPDGGGEIVTSPLVDTAGNIHFGTWGEGPYETEAIYSVDPEGELNWRYPADSSLSHRLFASPAQSPDGSTLYYSTFVADSTGLPGYLYAIDITASDDATDDQRLKWRLPLDINGAEVITTTLAVTTDGTIIVGGLYFDATANSNVPVAIAVTDEGDRGEFVWTPVHTEFRDGAHLVLGIALREESDTTQRIYVTTANLGTPIFNAKVEGELYAVRLSDGLILGNYDPSDDVPGAIGSINSPAIGADGVIYFGVRGRFGDNSVNGHYFGVRYDDTAEVFEYLWSFEVDGHIEWNHPAIGPDGAIYGGSSAGGSGSSVALTTYNEDEIPEGSTPHFYRIAGATSVAVDPVPSAAAVDFDIFPNPSNSDFTIELLHASGTSTIKLYSVTGRLVARLALNSLLSGTRISRRQLLGSAHLAAGVYYIRLSLDDGRGNLALPVVKTIVIL